MHNETLDTSRMHDLCTQKLKLKTSSPSGIVHELSQPFRSLKGGPRIYITPDKTNKQTNPFAVPGSRNLPQVDHQHKKETRGTTS